MFEYIHGTLIESHLTHAIVEANGIGYKIHTPLNLSPTSLALNTKVKLFLSEVIREDSHELFGFSNKEHRDLFVLLCQVSGIGPKTALALVGHLELAALIDAISSGNVTLLCQTPGIGKKSAERLIVEMKDRLKKIPLPSSPTSKRNPHLADGISALVNLGYPLATAQRAVEKALQQMNEEDELSHVIRRALIEVSN